MIPTEHLSRWALAALLVVTAACGSTDFIGPADSSEVGPERTELMSNAVTE